uniref:Uncharacterized protein n=1 Tax=Setaria viridis TaxID=4556 RepID=A0A4U6TF06_SETVI|nr:hypothetical protein SEVIR_8G054566v2 [Setaria viridis]
MWDLLLSVFLRLQLLLSLVHSSPVCLRNCSCWACHPWACLRCLHCASC